MFDFITSLFKPVRDAKSDFKHASSQERQQYYSVSNLSHVKTDLIIVSIIDVCIIALCIYWVFFDTSILLTILGILVFLIICSVLNILIISLSYDWLKIRSHFRIFGMFNHNQDHSNINNDNYRNNSNYHGNPNNPIF